MLMLRGISVTLGLSCALGLLAGCKEAGPERTQVEGTVTLDGEPLPFKSVTFSPESGTEGNGAAGGTDPDGKYTLTAIVFGSLETYRGCPPGSYRVTVTEPMVPVTAEDFEEAGELPEEEDESAPAPAVGLGGGGGGRSDIPAIYTNGDRTPLRAEVPESGPVVIDFELVSNPG